MEENRKGNAKCVSCYKPLPEEGRTIGLCGECATREIAKLKKRMKVSLAVSVVLLLIVFAVRFYVCTHYFIGDYGEVIVPAFFGTMMFNVKSFQRIFYPTFLSGTLFLAFCFFAPFSSFVNIEYNTYRHKAEQQLYKTDPFGGMTVASANKQRTDDAGLFIVSVMLSVISGPYFFVRRVYKLRQLSNYVRRLSESGNNLQ